jgi:hypothetical protein
MSEIGGLRSEKQMAKDMDQFLGFCLFSCLRPQTSYYDFALFVYWFHK